MVHGRAARRRHVARRVARHQRARPAVAPADVGQVPRAVRVGLRPLGHQRRAEPGRPVHALLRLLAPPGARVLDLGRVVVDDLVGVEDDVLVDVEGCVGEAGEFALPVVQAAEAVAEDDDCVGHAVLADQVVR